MTEESQSWGGALTAQQLGDLVGLTEEDVWGGALTKAQLIALAGGTGGGGLSIDALGLFSARSTYNSEPEGFVYLATDNGNLYVRQGAPGNWSAAIPFVGPPGAAGPAGPAGPAGAAGAPGAAGANGKTVLSGTAVPAAGLGVDGDFYIRTGVWTIYGPKAGGVWGAATSIIGPAGAAGATGATGAAGAPGAAGADGRTVRSGTTVPAAGLGVDGDFYIRTSDWTIYGPKTAGAWGAATSIIGPAGAAGATGATGPAGASGVFGPIACHITAANTAAAVGVVPGFPMLFNATLTGLFVVGNPGPAGANFICHPRQGGTNILSTPLSIDAGEVSSLTAAVPPVISNSTLTRGSWIDFNITQVGVSPNQGQNFVVVFEIAAP